MIQELPYRENSVDLFECLSGTLWPVFLDSGRPHTTQGRYDVLAADPYISLTTTKLTTEIRRGGQVGISTRDPLVLLKQQLDDEGSGGQSYDLPFSGGAIGYFGYDLGRRLEDLPELARDEENIPDMMIGLYDWAVVVDHFQRRSWLVGQGHDADTESKWQSLADRFTRIPAVSNPEAFFRVSSQAQSNMTKDEYVSYFRRIKRYLMEGDCYQVNLAQRFVADCEGDPWEAYKVLREINPAPFSCFLDFSSVQVLSSSPERFLKIRDRMVETKPIKGTLPRVADVIDDQQQAVRLRNSKKDRAENLMIVDLLRNDIGKSCIPGSVKVPKLFDVETFATVHHLVSTIRGELAPGIHSLDLFRGCFPGGSITGAPKIRAMEIIEELEPDRRGVYCGSIGYVGFDGAMDTNIAIRTLVHSGSSIRFWAGGGIVADSRELAEYQESFDKAAAMLKLLERMEESPGSGGSRKLWS